ncbi:MAG: sulfatase [Anaerolinea sp.]|nr:sulfatase [Anaerolinea sp.]
MKKPDIILIVLDTQRADRLGAYGYQRSLTPNLDKFAAASALFTQAVSPAQWTIPSHASLFTGLYPTVHQVTQSTHSLNPEMPHLVEMMQAAGYETVGFCNNPLVGILNNGFKRGFDTFYNYGGAIPSVPESSARLPWPFNKLLARYTQFLRRISYPIQNFFGQSDLAFRISLHAWLTPLWSRFANFKGQNERSVRDVTHFLQERERQPAQRPLFLFLNLMETHMPFWPPGEFIDQVAPYLRHNKEARTIMRTWNREAYRWAAPLEEPLSELEQQVLSDLYDAEVAYQDHYLGQLLAMIDGRHHHHNTLTLIVADHGDGLGEHGYMGHAFAAYEELVHVPLILHWPDRIKPGQVTTPVSTRRVFHTLLDAAGQQPDAPTNNPAEIRALTLLQTIYGRDPERHTAFSEIYPPLNFVKAIERRQAHLLAQRRCLSMRRAVVKTDETAATLKLIQVDDQVDELFDLENDPAEMHNLLAERPSHADALTQDLNRLAANAERQRLAVGNGRAIETEIDESLMQRLRALGYVDY